MEVEQRRSAWTEDKTRFEGMWTGHTQHSCRRFSALSPQKPTTSPRTSPASSAVLALSSHTHPLSLPLAAAMSEKVDAPTSSDASLAKGGDPSQGPKAIIKNVDMSEDMQQEAVDIAHAALEKYNIEKDIAAQIKKEFDKRHGPTWHVVVGKNFGSYVTHGESSLRVVAVGVCVARTLRHVPLRGGVVMDGRVNSPFAQKRSTSSTSTSAPSPSSSGSHRPLHHPERRRRSAKLY